MNTDKAMRIRIVSDGDEIHTRIETEDGVRIDGVTRVVWECVANESFARATLYFARVAIDAKVAPTFIGEYT